MRRAILTVCLVFSVFLCGQSTSTVASEPAAKPARPATTPSKAVERSAERAAASEDEASRTKADSAKETKTTAKVRKFRFQYRFRVKGLVPTGEAERDLVRVWLPRPSSSDCQEITQLEAAAPVKVSEHEETQYGNRLLYFQTAIPATREFTVDIPYEVTRHEVMRAAASSSDLPMEKLDAAMRARLLGADSMVPIAGKPLKLLASIELRKDKLGLARQLYDVVDDHVVYKKEGIGWGRGDTNWVCESGYGNCTDFHSLFISLARSQGLPARFEIGFSIPTDKSEGLVVGYHCWAWFYLDERGWIPVDISEADKHPEMKDYYFGNLTADRVQFSVGRDLDLVPKSAHRPLNFLVNPYIEVGDTVLPTENIELQFAFRDIR